MRSINIVSRCIICLLLPFWLASCGLFQQPAVAPVKVKHVAKLQHYQTDEFLKHAALADIMLAGAHPDNVRLSPHLDFIDGFSTQKQKTSFEPVVVLAYTAKGKKSLQRVIAPFNSRVPTDTSALLNIMTLLQAQNYALQDVRAARVTVTPIKLLKLKEKDPGIVKAVLDQQIQAWLQQLQGLAPVAEAEVQIKLIHFFMEHRMREAAYLSVENAKQALALGAEHNADPKAVQALTQQLAQLESQLRVVMPFTAF